MAESARDRDEWRRRHSLLALWQDAAALELRDTSLLSLAVDDRPEEADRATLHDIARSCHDVKVEHAGNGEAAEAAAPLRPACGTEAVDDVTAAEPSGEAVAPHPDHGSAAPVSGHSDSDHVSDSGLLADPAFSPWQPAHGSVTHPEPSAPKSQMDEISESLREVRKELNLLRERRARRYF